MKRVYLYDENGGFSGVYDAQESPLEKGVYITPVNSTDIAPPAITQKQELRFYNGAWNVVDLADPEPPAPPTPEELRAAFTDAVQQHIDAVARARGYDSGISCASYFNDPHPPFNDDAQAFVPWRSSVWLYCYAEFDKLLAGQREMIPLDQFITELPVAPWSIA